MSKFTNWLGAVAGVTGGGRWKTRLGVLGGTTAAGLLGSAYIGHVADVKRNYYGQARYDSYFGAGAETLQGLAMVGAGFFGLPALIGRDYITRLANSYDYYTGGKKLLSLASTPTAIKNMIRTTPKFGLVQIASLTTMFTGSAAFANPELTLGILGGAVAAGGVGAAYAANRAIKGTTMGAKLSKAIADYTGGYSTLAKTAGATLAGGALGYAAVNRANNVAGEGNIQSFDTGSVVSRMNWSTAGLGLAIHNRTRKVAW